MNAVDDEKRATSSLWVMRKQSEDVSGASKRQNWPPECAHACRSTAHGPPTASIRYLPVMIPSVFLVRARSLRMWPPPAIATQAH